MTDRNEEIKETIRETYLVDYKVWIPNLNGEGIIEKVLVKIPVFLDAYGDEVLTEQAFDIIESTKARRLEELFPTGRHRPGLAPTQSNSELIWVVPVEQVYDLISPTGGQGQMAEIALRHDDNRPPPEALPCMGRLFMDRASAETDESFLQPIPYVVIVQGGKLIRYRRLPKAGEGRLAGRTSVGAGGHLSADFRPPASPSPEQIQPCIAREIRREICEEFTFRFTSGQNTGWYASSQGFPQARFLGYLMDRRDAVGRVHLGLLYALELPGGIIVEINPMEEHKLRMESPFDPHVDRDPDLEGWSRLVTENWEIWASALGIRKV
jgi:predicted NUDIX family phosphoesterase